jgi:hypothetical protein
MTAMRKYKIHVYIPYVHAPWQGLPREIGRLSDAELA